jgi:HSP20 family protein
MDAIDVTQLLLQGIENINSGENLSGMLSSFNQGVVYSPRYDLIEDDTNIIIYMELPGVNKENVEIDFFNNKLEVICSRDKSYEITAKKSEIFYGNFQRKISLPIVVSNRESVKTTLKNGILTITINKTLEERNRFRMNVG